MNTKFFEPKGYKLSKMKSESAQKMYELLTNTESVKDISSNILQIISLFCAYKEKIECAWCDRFAPSEVLFIFSDDEESTEYRSSYRSSKYGHVIEEHGWEEIYGTYHSYRGVACPYCLEKTECCSFCDTEINLIKEDPTPASCCDVVICWECYDGDYCPHCAKQYEEDEDVNT